MTSVTEICESVRKQCEGLLDGQRISVAVFLYDGASTQGFFISRGLGAVEVLELADAGREFERRLGGSWECQIVRLGTALDNFCSNEGRPRSEVTVQDLIDHFCVDIHHDTDIETWELIEALKNVKETDLVPPDKVQP